MNVSMEAESGPLSGSSSLPLLSPDSQQQAGEDTALLPRDDPSSAMNDIIYASQSFGAVVRPVILAMVLSVFATTSISTPYSLAARSQGMGEYEVFDASTDSGDTSAVRLGKAFLNVFIMIAFIATITFVLVAVYRFRCVKCLHGYLVLTSAVLLGLVGGFLWETAIEKWQIVIDRVTFSLVLYNFAVVGCMAIFWSKGIPTIVTQGYLVASAVIMAWNVGGLDEWMCWALLVGMALYDLWAVLSPCGPLYALLNAMHEHGDPLPGLLYEAELAPAVNGASAVLNAARDSHGNSDGISDSAEAVEQGHANGGSDRYRRSSGGGRRRREASAERSSSSEQAEENDRDGDAAAADDRNEDSVGLMRSRNDTAASSGGASSDQQTRTNLAGADAAKTSLPAAPGMEIRVPAAAAGDTEGGEDALAADGANSIRLGLGDFIFYSVLASRAAMHGFVTCAACLVAVVSGLCATMVLLALRRSALPALPISILFGVGAYFATRFCVKPLSESLGAVPMYV